MTLMTWQYFFMAAKSFSSCFLPSSSCHFLQYLVKAFFLDLYLRAQQRLAPAPHDPCRGQRRSTVHSSQARSDQAGPTFRLMARFLSSTFHRPAEPGAHRGALHPSGATVGSPPTLDSLSFVPTGDQHLLQTNKGGRLRTPLTSSCRSGACIRRSCVRQRWS